MHHRFLHFFSICFTAKPFSPKSYEKGASLGTKLLFVFSLSHPLARMAFFLAGAVGLEPTTNGFGVAHKVRNPLKILAFRKHFQNIKTQIAML